MCKKIELANKLKEERSRLPKYNMFGEKNNLIEYDYAIAYLENDIKPKNWESIDLLVAVIEDFDTIYNDYL